MSYHLCYAATMKMCKSQRCYPAEHLASGSKFDRTDPDYVYHRLQRMRAESLAHFVSEAPKAFLPRLASSQPFPLWTRPTDYLSPVTAPAFRFQNSLFSLPRLFA